MATVLTTDSENFGDFAKGLLALKNSRVSDMHSYGGNPETMDPFEKDEVPMLSATFSQVDEHAVSRSRRFSPRMRSASISIPMDSVESYEHTNVGHTGPLRSQRRTPFVQMSGPLYADRKQGNSFQVTQAVIRHNAAELTVEDYPSVSGIDHNDWPGNSVGKNEHLLRSGQLGMCNDPYCTTCPSYYNVKGQQKYSKASAGFDPKFHSLLYGDAKGWAKRALSFLHPYIPGVMNPHAKVVQQWNKLGHVYHRQSTVLALPTTSPDRSSASTLASLPPPPPRPPLHRSSRISKPLDRFSFLVSPSIAPIPSSFMQAAIRDCWNKAMQVELDALDENRTWDLVLWPPYITPIGCKCVFTSFTPTTFALVAEMTTVLLLLSLAASQKWQLLQMDVKNAFLHGKLSEIIYMRPPPGLDNVPSVSFVASDALYMGSSRLLFRLAYVAPESRVVGAGDLVDHPKKIAINYLFGYFLIDFFVVLPLPQYPRWPIVDHRNQEIEVFLLKNKGGHVAEEITSSHYVGSPIMRSNPHMEQ
ncbi:hypothetical protein RJ639_016848 [Escallonia herrerae]|uniref:Reverse transcriptase Ty1/copia-type domain-containing protein n=1 Tax=Escallonia herrerae TaxID=1293975 RepID=A0AA88VBA1_9ASTE|nr:hypothetical protein RJ639_016848 [Escallonia herrerae]